MRGLTAVCTAARHISLTAGWSWWTARGEGSKMRWRERLWRGAAPGQGSRAGLTDTLETISSPSLWSQEPVLSLVGSGGGP